ncbi:hypothetical protein RIF29_09408 [Crotalaria pallida]|uniref:Uncharacterized protein n=1 Tax=Crotalaria pallida TaxID=3830 RepID=A0AAN9IJM8_CROPI
MEVDTEPQTPADVSMEEDTESQTLPPPPPPPPLPGSSIQRATLPINIAVESPTTKISFTVTTDSITTGAGEWSQVLPNLSRGLSLPDHISLPATIAITATTFIIRVSVTTACNTFYDVTPIIPLQQEEDLNNNNNNNTLPITNFPISLTLCLVNLSNKNTGLAFGISITDITNISIATQLVRSQFGYAAFLRMK